MEIDGEFHVHDCISTDAAGLNTPLDDFQRKNMDCLAASGTLERWFDQVSILFTVLVPLERPNYLSWHHPVKKNSVM